MRESYRITPVYTGDVSGVCSALYELGGMVVIDDPSGCNSTYNTHDEVRWYDRESLIFISGLNERDAVLGNDEKLIRDTVEAAESLHPAFIAFCNSPVPFLTGRDYKSIARITEKRTGIPSFYVPTNGMHDYVYGAQNAYLSFAEKMLPAHTCALKVPGTRINLLGLTPLDFADGNTVPDLKRLLSQNGFTVNASFSMNTSLEEVKTWRNAAANLVLSSTALPLAEYFEKSCGMPFTAGCPVPGLEQEVFASLLKAARTGVSSYPCMDARKKYGREKPESGGDKVCLIGEPVFMCSLAAAMEKERETSGKEKKHEMYEAGCISVYLPLEGGGKLLLPALGDRRVYGEEEIEEAFSGASVIYGDPYYRVLAPEKAVFRPVPHLAFSGRIYLKDIRNPFRRKEEENGIE